MNKPFSTGTTKNGAKKTKTARQRETSDYINFDDNDLVKDLAGAHDAHLAILEKIFDIRIDPRGNRFAISGVKSARNNAAKALKALYTQLADGVEINAEDVRAAANMARPQSNFTHNADAVIIKTPKRKILPRTENQARYLNALATNDLVFGIGPAGTGKTYLAVAHAVHMLLSNQVERLILTRPALEAGERIGFLPGDMKEKVDPYLRPLYDALHDMMDTDFVERRLAAGDIEIAPLGFMRGRTLARAAVILDEGQNATVTQMKMFLTRLGEGATMVVTGDPDQTDLPTHEKSGLADAFSILKGVKGVSYTKFTAKDVVRHPLVSRIIKAYDRRNSTN